MNGTRFLVFSLVGAAAAVVLAVSPTQAADYMRDKPAAEALLKGKTLKGIYLRTKSSYTLRFGADGALVNQAGAEGHWWVNDLAQYCREWTSGHLQGNKACLDLAKTPQGIAIYHRGKKVAEGALEN